jgi:hypothetical protein
MLKAAAGGVLTSEAAAERADEARSAVPTSVGRSVLTPG